MIIILLKRIILLLIIAVTVVSGTGAYLPMLTVSDTNTLKHNALRPLATSESSDMRAKMMLELFVEQAGRLRDADEERIIPVLKTLID
ncbi:MAG: hypothetical protein ABH825_01470, partial [Candidatus Omnitrophota bacterium]